MFIEVSLYKKDEKMIINSDSITQIYIDYDIDKSGVTAIRLSNDSCPHVKETYEEIKNKLIKNPSLFNPLFS